MRSSHGLWAVLMGAASVCVCACVGGSKGVSAQDKEKVAPYVLDAPPADMGKAVDVNFENKVHLIGVKTDPAMAKPGSDVKVTFYWRCDDSVDDGWKLFTHVEDDGRPKNQNGIGNYDEKGVLREARGDAHQVMGPDRWEKGKIYVDELSPYHVPDDVKGATISWYVGIFKGDARLRIITGPTDGDNRAIAAQLQTGVKQEQPAQHTTNDVPSLTGVKLAANDKITIDGKADEPAWGGAASIGPFVDAGNGQPVPASAPVQGSAKLLFDDQNLYVFFDVKDPSPYMDFKDPASQPASFTAAGSPKLWDKDTVEMMVDPGPAGDNINYYEMQINPQNKVFDSQFDAYNSPKKDPNGPYGHEDWDSKVKSAVVLAKDGSNVTGYTVELAVPWTSYAKSGVSLPPKAGDVWRMNFYAMHNNGGAAWSAIMTPGRNFHFAQRFGQVMWGAAPAAPADAGPAADAAPAAALVDGGTTLNSIHRGLLPVHRPPNLIQQAPPAQP